MQGDILWHERDDSVADDDRARLPRAEIEKIVGKSGRGVRAKEARAVDVTRRGEGYLQGVRIYGLDGHCGGPLLQGQVLDGGEKVAVALTLWGADPQNRRGVGGGITSPDGDA